MIGLVFDYNNNEVIKTKTGYLGSENLDVFQICIILFSASDLFKLRKDIKIIFFYGEGSKCEKHKSNLLLVFNDYFSNARVEFDKPLR